MSRRKVWTVSRYVTLVAWRLVKKCRFSRMQQFAACLHFAWRTTSLRVSGRAARRSCLPGLHRGGGRQAGATVLSCLVWRCELALRKLTGYQSAQRRSNCDCNLLYITNNFFQCSGTNVSSFSLLFSFLRQNLTGPKNLIVAEKVRQFNAAVQTNSWFDVVNFFARYSYRVFTTYVHFPVKMNGIIFYLLADTTAYPGW